MSWRACLSELRYLTAPAVRACGSMPWHPADAFLKEAQTPPPAAEVVLQTTVVQYARVRVIHQQAHLIYLVHSIGCNLRQEGQPLYLQLESRPQVR
jgi:hypothetical protein